MKTLNISSLKKKNFFEVGFQDRCSMGGKLGKRKRRKKGVGERGSLVLDHGSICLETALGVALAVGRGGPWHKGVPSHPSPGTCGCPALPRARLEVFQS